MASAAAVRRRRSANNARIAAKQRRQKILVVVLAAVLVALLAYQVPKLLERSGDGSASVEFAPPSGNGSPVTGYSILVSPGGRAVSCPASPCTVTGLTNGSTYSVAVVATNAVGDSVASPSQAVTPVVRADGAIRPAPRTLALTGGGNFRLAASGTVVVIAGSAMVALDEHKRRGTGSARASQV